MAVIVAWPLKRSAFARLQGYAYGTIPLPSAVAGVLAPLVSNPPSYPVQVEYALPPNPDRVCIYGGPLRLSRRDAVEESNVLQVETVTLEVRVRVYLPGDDIVYADTVTGGLVQAVVTALTWVDPPLIASGSINLSSATQDPTAVAPDPEPSVVTFVSLVFTAEVSTI